MNQQHIQLAAIAVVSLGMVVATAAPTDEAAREPSIDPHAHHRHAAAASATTRSAVNYRVPDVRVVRDDGKAVRLADEIEDGRAVVLAFIYTTCTAICPLISATFAQLQGKLGADAARVQLVSISIDPEQDTPPRLAEYAKQWGAGPNWHHYTGAAEASIAIQRAFNAYRGDKMNHMPVTFIRRTPGQRWIRVEGFVSSDELLAECCGTTALK